MSLTVNTFSLTAIEPVVLTYRFNDKEEKINLKLKSFDNQLSFAKHGALEDYEDIVFSKGNCLALTNTKSLKQIIDVSSKVSKNFLGNKLTNCSFFLKYNNEKYLKKYKNAIYAGGIGTNSLFSIVVVGDNLVEIKTDKTENLRIQQTYPYDIYISEEEVDPLDNYTKQFEIDYYEEFITLRCKVDAGYRYLSCGIDGKLRAVGVMLNDTAVNSYLLTPEFVSAETELTEDFSRLDSIEVFYYNELGEVEEYENLSIRKKQENETNVLLTCSTFDLINEERPPTNIALLKSNYSASGAYSTK